MYAQYVNSVYTIHNSKYGLPKSTNAGQKKKKQSRKRELKNADAEPKRTLCLQRNIYFKNKFWSFIRVDDLQYVNYYIYLFILFSSNTCWPHMSDGEFLFIYLIKKSNLTFI